MANDEHICKYTQAKKDLKIKNRIRNGKLRMSKEVWHQMKSGEKTYQRRTKSANVQMKKHSKKMKILTKYTQTWQRMDIKKQVVSGI